MSQPQFSLYIVRCKDGSLYTGITTNVDRRIREHEAGRRGAKYLSGRAPLRLVFEEPVGTRSQALQLEHRVKKLKRSEKKALVEGNRRLQDLLSHHDSVPVAL